jgi:hypothetical protein
MTPLGEHFPEAIKRQRVTQKIKPGAVIRLDIKFPEITKPKFLVLVAEDDPDYWTFIVNSEINPFIAKRPHLMQCQVAIDAAGHPFLSRDSHIACNEVLKLKREDVIRELTADPSAIKGEITPQVKDQILAAVKFADTLSASDKKRIVAGLENQ